MWVGEPVTVFWARSGARRRVRPCFTASSPPVLRAEHVFRARPRWRSQVDEPLCVRNLEVLTQPPDCYIIATNRMLRVGG